METVDVVVPCFQGETTIRELVEELSELREGQVTDTGISWAVEQVFLVFDGGSSALILAMSTLKQEFKFVQTLFLSTNFGQHSATLAGFTSTRSKWIVTLDEDLLHAPRDIGILLDTANSSRSLLVYGAPNSPPNHGLLRNFSSQVAKRLAAALLGIHSATMFQSFRLLAGEIGRDAAMRTAAGVYLDVALSWYVLHPSIAAVEYRDKIYRPTTYSGRRLVRHFQSLAFSSGPRVLRLLSAVSLAGVLAGAVAVGVVFGRVTVSGIETNGWASLLLVILSSSALILAAISTLANYLSRAIGAVLGKPAFFQLESQYFSSKGT